jgi:hypothetical protein
MNGFKNGKYIAKGTYMGIRHKGAVHSGLSQLTVSGGVVGGLQHLTGEGRVVLVLI